MANDANEITIGDNVLRLEQIKLPSGNTYKLGCSFEEAQDISNALTTNINLVNDDLEDLSDVTGVSKNQQGERVFAPTTNYGGNSSTIMANMQALDTKIKLLADEIATLQQLLSDKYMAYYDASVSPYIGSDNTYDNDGQIDDDSDDFLF